VLLLVDEVGVRLKRVGMEMLGKYPTKTPGFFVSWRLVGEKKGAFTPCCSVVTFRLVFEAALARNHVFMHSLNPLTLFVALHFSQNKPKLKN